MVNYSDVKGLPNWSKRHLIKIETGNYSNPQVEVEIIFLGNRNVDFGNIKLEDFIDLIESSGIYFKIVFINEDGEDVRTLIDKGTTLKNEFSGLPKIICDDILKYFNEVYKNEKRVTFEKLADKYNTYQELAENLINELYKNKRDINWREVAQFLFDKANTVGLL